MNKTTTPVQTSPKLRCRFGRPHLWSIWYENGKLVKDANTLHCSCGEVTKV